MKEEKKAGLSIKNIFGKYHNILAIVLACFYPCFFVFYANIEEIGLKGLSYIWEPVLMYLTIALVVYFISYVATKKVAKASFITTFILTIICNFVMINKIFNFVFACDYKLQVIVMTIMIVLLIVIVKCTKLKIDYGMLCDIICFAIAFLVVTDCLMAGVKLCNKQDVKKSEVSITKTKESNRNIYYMILDEYSGEEGLEYYYGLDNSELYGFLEGVGCNVIRKTHNYEGLFTHEIVPNILNLDYVTSISGVASKNVELTQNAKLIEFFKDSGYSIKLVNDEGFLKDDGCEVVGGKNYKKYSIDEKKNTQQIIYGQSVISVLLLMFNKLEYTVEQKQEAAREKEALFDSYFENCGLSDEKKVLIGYFNIPHEPFLFEHDGTVTDDTNVGDWGDKEKYTEQLGYVNTQIKKIVEKIVKDDPDSIIVIQSDHGSRYAKDNMSKYKKKDYDEVKETENMQNVINVVYMGGENVDIQDGTSCINTWRTILNKEFGSNLDMIDCKKLIYHWKAMVD